MFSEIVSGSTVKGARPLLPAARPFVVPQPQAAKPANRFEQLTAAVQAGPAALARFAAYEQSKRNNSAQQEWRGYRLRGGAIVNPEGTAYKQEQTMDAVWRFVGCPDQVFVDAVNDALRQAGEVFRLETKHRIIWFLLERNGEVA